MFTAVVTISTVPDHDGDTYFLFDEVVHDEEEYADLLFELEQRTHYRITGHKGKITVLSEITRRTSNVLEF